MCHYLVYTMNQLVFEFDDPLPHRSDLLKCSMFKVVGLYI